MALARTIHADLFRVFLLTLVSLFAIPAATLVFTEYALRTEDAEFLQAIEKRIASDTRLSAGDKAQATEFYRSHPLSKACSATAPEDKNFHDKVCSPYSMHWQFHWADRAAGWTLVLGAALLAAALVLGALAFANRGLRYASFVAGWRLMTVSSALEVALQGAMLVWLSFWLTAYFMQSYYVKLIIIAGIAAAVAVFYAIYTLFKKLPFGNEIEGEVVAEADAPRLWERIRQLAARVKTAPPDQIVAGIDTNFFVTEAPCEVGGRTLQGRTLFVSIPLLRVLDQSEADAVLAHELAHLGGGDTRSSAALGPKLLQFDQYTWKMREGGLSIVAHYLLRLYRMIFAFALARDSREREYKADSVAASLTAPGAIVQSLIKIAAYASYRNDVERKLFAQDRQHDGALGIAGFVAAGLPPYANSDAFVETMKTADVPHPYDSHPPLLERMRNVGHHVPESAYGAIVATAPAASWADDIETAAAIEQRLWSDYEQRFVQNHELSLAYRYEPATEEERAVVLRHFPPVAFALKNGENIEVSHAGLRQSVDGGSTIGWDEVKNLTFQDNTFGDLLVVTHHDKGMLGARTTKVKVGGLGKQKENFKGAVGRYWQRHQIMRAQQQQQQESPQP
ncbi:Zn-dependent protease with chaperone function [Variovorax beijingensis]|uniref:Zn-dependent protease with chaperone function n=2 Tax=Variovorax TaxID=34072 RepID=A0AAE4C1A8_VARPD|nr:MULTISPECIES: M48 family metallopeptidase [Variovorax]MBD9665895.1 M48 family metalloprotease [Variovorax sp. VRV01]MDP9968557.1 Zn-dependent protease with chaperone function [Variovorax paradoxus]MDR6430097.1 Zn-dependent protease with chaperone function [Variovorax paradoxus]MDR6456669.1 Zn-dependent protease with chaperone function [Variovorax paradoxus]TWD75540.1 Zn-dependent protease with chaperone function [Variovorax beijingensis]